MAEEAVANPGGGIETTGGGVTDGQITSQPAKDPAYQAQLKPEYQGHEALVNHADFNSIVGDYIDLKAKDGLRVPGENANPEEVEAFFNELGVPKTADKYTLDGLKVPESLEIDPKKIAESAKKHNLTDAQMQGFVKDVLGLYNEDETRIFKAMDEAKQQGHDFMNEKWGKDADVKRADGLRILGKGAELAGLDIPGFMEHIKSAGFLDDPNVMIPLSALAAATSEDRVLSLEMGATAPNFKGEVQRDEYGQPLLDFPKTPGMH